MMTFSHEPAVAEQQMRAIIFYLTAFGYIDGDFDMDEKGYIRDHVAKLVEHRARGAMKADDPALADVVARWTKHFHEVVDEVDHQILEYFTESVAEGESTEKFVFAKLKLRCFELYKGFDEENRKSLLDSVDELMHADGVVHPNEKIFRDELQRLLHAPLEVADGELEEVPAEAIVIEATRTVESRITDHPFFKAAEWDYSRDPEEFARQAQGDMNLIEKVIERFDAQRERGLGRLTGKKDFCEFDNTEPFLDGHVYVLPPQANKEYELLVIGDLHGCYSCLKAALLQADFFAKVEANHERPGTTPEMKLVLLGDYIDRGRYSYNGILRTAMHLFLTVPEHVYMLRGNHEYYVEFEGKVVAPVRPAEAMQSLQGIAANEIFAGYMRLFDALPNMLIFDRTVFVHAGIPRDSTIRKRYVGLESLNNPEIRFEMLWSDPSEADAIPEELQNENSRFPFGTRQFRNFMTRVGLTTLVRGHERIIEGFRQIYDFPDARLLSLFSAGGKTNSDLPPRSNYREVTPMALTIRHKDGVSRIEPFVIDYERYNDPRYNSFLTAAVG